MPEIICKQCGKTFIKTGRGRHIYCSEKCKHKYNNHKLYLKRKQKRKQEREKELAHMFEEKKVKVSAGSSLTEINQRARELHMTYGQYMARYGG